MRRAAALLAALVVLVLGQLVNAGPAAAHAELVTTTPPNGARLAEAPRQVVLDFTESVGLLEDGIRLLDADGRAVDTPEPVAAGSRVRWRMPDDLPDGAYLVSWRVVSSDSHPVAGAFSFGVGNGVSVEPVTNQEAATFDAPWPVMATRFGGYLGFTLLTGAIVLAALCWRPGRTDSRTSTLLRAGLVVAVASTVLALLVQGPYAAGQPLTRLFRRSLMSEASGSTFGAWIQLRLYLLVALGAVVWGREALTSRLNRWVAGGGVVLIAATFSGTSHAAGSGAVLERVADSTHVLAAGTWVGGLIALAWASATATGERPGRRALAAFSRLAVVAVLVLVATGTASSLYRLNSVEELWTSRYGRILALKLVLVAVALAVAALSRRRLHRGDTPWRTVRVEAAVTVAVLVMTSVLTGLAPPPTSPASVASDESRRAKVELPLVAGRSARVEVDPPRTGGSRLTVSLRSRDGSPLEAAGVRLQATLKSRDVGPLTIGLTRGDGPTWRGRFAFPFPGTWTLTLTVEDQPTALVTAGKVEIS